MGPLSTGRTSLILKPISIEGTNLKIKLIKKTSKIPLSPNNENDGMFKSCPPIIPPKKAPTALRKLKYVKHKIIFCFVTAS